PGAAGVFESVAYGLATLWIPLTFAALFLFPSGRLISRRWRVAGWLYPLTMATGFMASVVNGGWGGDQEKPVHETPVRDLVHPLGDVLSQVFVVLLPVVAITALVSLAIRFVRSRGAERLQMKLLAFASTVTVATLVVVTASASGAAIDTPLQTVVSSLAILLIPVAIMFAVMRYGLYEIDRIISRTLAYAIVVTRLAALFVAGVLLIPQLLPSGSSNLAVATSTLAVAALFNPLRRRVQVAVDRVFNRTRYDYQVVADQFAFQIRNQVDPSLVMDEFIEVAATTLQPESTAYWVRSGP
ncbi:MAG: hypothetical protein ACR2NL_04150, partial [Acidimicrobiia bacterium]